MAPTDCAGIIHLDTRDNTFTAHLGQQWSGIPAAIKGHTVVLADQHLRSCSLETGEQFWSMRLQNQVRFASGVANGDSGWLITLDHEVWHLNADGNVQHRRSMREDNRLIPTDSLIVGYDGEMVTALGDGDAFQERIAQQMQKDPNNPQPWAAMAALHAARGENEFAFQHFVEALKRGAQERVARRAAALIRSRIDLQLGVKSAEELLDKFAIIAQYDKALAWELRWWQGRHLEEQGNTEEAIELYRTIVSKAPAIEIPSPANARTQLSTLAQLSILRASKQLRPLGNSLKASVSSVMRRSVSWEKEWNISGPLMATEKYLLAHADGRYRGIDLQTGTSAWDHLTQQRALLGVEGTRLEVENEPTGIRVRVIPGMGAERMGLQNEDLLLTCNDVELQTFADLVTVIADIGPGGAVVITGKRNDESFTIRSQLDGWPRGSAAMTKQFIVAERLELETTRRGKLVRPDRSNQPFFDIFSRAGKHLHHLPLLPQSGSGAPWKPLFFGEDTLLINDNSDLVALHITQEAVNERWRVEDAGPALRNFSVTDNGIGIASLEEQQEIWLLDLNQGQRIMAVPSTLHSNPMVYEQQLFAATHDGKLACWDIDRSRLRWIQDSDK